MRSSEKLKKKPAYDGRQWAVKHRPSRLEDVYGQDAAVSFIRGLVKRGAKPNCILITGPSGTGKTTLGRLIAAILSEWKGDVDNNPDCIELAANVDRSIEDVRTSIEMSRYLPRGGKRRVMLVDEIQGYVGPAASAMLKAVEDPPKHTTWILCTDQPFKLPRQMSMRTVVINLKLAQDEEVAKYLAFVCKKEGISFGEKHEVVLKKIAQISHGAMRAGVQSLEKVYTIIKGGGKLTSALEAVASEASVDVIDSVADYVSALLKTDSTRAVKAVSSCKSPDGMLDLTNTAVLTLIRVLSGSNPNQGVGWVFRKKIAVNAKDLPALLTLQSRLVAALDVKSRYAVPVESLLYGLAR